MENLKIEKIRKIEKVIKGLKCCNYNKSYQYFECPSGCPYKISLGAGCKYILHDDAINLLKDQRDLLIKEIIDNEYIHNAMDG